MLLPYAGVTARLKRDGTRAETRVRLSPKRTSPFKSAGASVQSTAGSQGVRISRSNAGYTMFRDKSTGYPLHSPVSSSFPLSCVTVCHQVSNALYKIKTWLLPELSLEVRLQQLVLFGALCCITRHHISRDTYLNNSCGRNRFVRNRASSLCLQTHIDIHDCHKYPGSLEYAKAWFYNPMGQDSSDGIVTRYGLEVQGSNLGGGRDFPHRSRPALGPTQPPIQWVPGISRGKRAGAWL